MFVLDIPFNVLTGMITSLTVGLGVAYSIHLSERYNQELARTGDVWTAMDRAVTGTGGALLGSAATTVGGFGVLVFAILPPLQQFGLITGLTIVYAFLASVLVLPSLLVVWTRFVGPSDVGLGDSDDGPTAPVDGPGDGPADGPTVVATREFDRDVVAPGQAVTVTVRLPEVAGRAVLSERAGQRVEAVEADPEPVDITTGGGAVYAAWADATPVLRYTTVVPDGAADGDRLDFEGEVLVGGDTYPVEGDAELEVVTDVFERITAAGTVSENDLETAYDRFAEGALSQSQLERINRAWLRGTETPGERAADD
jgi:hypothetical protein